MGLSAIEMMRESLPRPTVWELFDETPSLFKNEPLGAPSVAPASPALSQWAEMESLDYGLRLRKKKLKQEMHELKLQYAHLKKLESDMTSLRERMEILDQLSYQK